jgi:hypothetical protein
MKCGISAVGLQGRKWAVRRGWRSGGDASLETSVTPDPSRTYRNQPEDNELMSLGIRNAMRGFVSSRASCHGL